MLGLKSSNFIIFIIVFSGVAMMTQNIMVSLIVGGLALVVTKASVSVNRDGNQQDNKLDYILEILALVSVILTKDKKILNSELNYVKRFLSQNFSDEEAKHYLLKFREFTKKDLSIEKVCVRINEALDSSGKRQILHLIIGAAVADRELTEGELKDIYIIGNRLRIGPLTVKSLLSMHTFSYAGSQQYQRQDQRQYQYQRSRGRTSTSNVNQAYKVLEITPQATETEIKKAYRKLAIIYHPDKVASMGESYQKSAKEKFQKVQAAYEQVKEARGMN